MKPESAPDLTAIPLFHGLTVSQRQQVILAARSRSLHTGAYLFQQGDPAQDLYILTQGRIKLSQVTPEGQQVILRYAAPGEAFGVTALLSRQEYPVSAEAVEDSLALAWPHEALQTLMHTIPDIATNALQVLVERVIEFQDRIRELSTERVERRIARALLRLASQTGRKTPEGILIDLTLSRQDLAEMTGTTLYTVSRTLSAWESKGLIHSGRERVWITRAHALVQIAEDLPDPHPRP